MIGHHTETPRRDALTDLRIPVERVLGSSQQWRAMLSQNKQGGYLATLDNCMTALSLAPEWQSVLAWDEFKMRVIAARKTPWGSESGAWDDDADRQACRWLQREGITVKTNIAGEAVQSVARSTRVHPVRDYLQSLRWDGDSRIDTWLTTYLGSPENPYVSTVGAKWLISGVARILRPGAKVDSLLVLEGSQGAGKSSALKVLARREDWFTDELADLGSKDSALQLAGRWIIEIAELGAMHRATVEKVKGFLSRQTDKFRPPYGRHVHDAARQCIFAGSTNADQYLLDETGNRRFWPVRCSEIKLADLDRDADQLWAEAVVRFEEGATWWLSREAAADADREASERYHPDPWSEEIEAYLLQVESASVAEILRDCIRKPRDQWTQIDQNRIARTLKALGWNRRRFRRNGRLEWRYIPADALEFPVFPVEESEVGTP